jgi:prepilin-type N-terminal cleavage/methylation domain-containing protein/prepilin-type processing-associated H-X9-DG protein
MKRMHRRAFTIVELIVVMGIISVLLGLLLPALSGVKAASRQLLCQSNLRQMGLAAQKYAALWDTYPAAIRYEEVEGEIHVIAWDWVTKLSDGDLISPGPLWGMTDDPNRVMQCPAYFGPSNFEGDPFTGYNYNTSYIGGEAVNQIGWEAVRRGVPPHACRRAAQCAIFGCGRYSGGANKFMRAPLSPNGWPLMQIYAGGQAFYYNGQTNVAYIDGHVAAVSQPREGEHATEELLDMLGYPDNGFLSDDDSAYNPRG